MQKIGDQRRILTIVVDEDSDTHIMITKCEEEFHLLKMNVDVTKVRLAMKLSIKETTFIDLSNKKNLHNESEKRKIFYRRGYKDSLECNLKCKIKKKEIVNS